MVPCSVGIRIGIQIVIGRIRFMIAIIIILIIMQVVLITQVKALYLIFSDVAQNAANFNKFVTVNNVLSTSINRLYKYIVPAGSTYVNDHPSNVVYLITCNKCKPRNVGETSQNLKKRFNWYNSCFRNPTAYSLCKILNTHFSKGYCKDSSYTNNIIGKFEGTGRTERQKGILYILQLNHFERLERLLDA